jgi:hypothetical protein
VTQLITTFLEGDLSLADGFSLDSDTKGRVLSSGKTLSVTHGEAGTPCLRQVALIDAFITRRVGVAEYTTTPFACYRCAGHKTWWYSFPANASHVTPLAVIIRY